MNKKDQVRQHLLKLANKAEFTLSSVAMICGVSTKDVSNVISPMFKYGVFERKMIDKIHHYTVDANAVNLYLAKFPAGQSGENGNGNGNGKIPPGKPARNKKRRSPAQMEIDRKIIFYLEKIEALKMIRKEFG